MHEKNQTDKHEIITKNDKNNDRKYKAYYLTSTEKEKMW